MKDISKSSESDNTAEMFCEYCYEKEQKNVTAEGFCVQCVKYFCKTCLGYHSKFLPDHIQQEKSIMPHDFYIEKCKKHRKELLKFYCITCDKILCSKCKTTLHKGCKDIHHLHKLVAEFDNVKECSTLEDNLDLLEKETEDLKEIIVKQGENTNKQYTNAIKLVSEQRQNAEIILDEFQGRIESFHILDKEYIDEEDNNNDLVKADIKDLKAEIRASKNSHHKSKIYMKTKKWKRKLEHIQERLKRQKCNLKYNNISCSFKKARNLMPESFGELTFHNAYDAYVEKVQMVFLIFVLILSCAVILHDPVEAKNKIIQPYNTIRKEFVIEHIPTMEKLSERSLNYMFSSEPENLSIGNIRYHPLNLLLVYNSRYHYFYNLNGREFTIKQPSPKDFIHCQQKNESMIAALFKDMILFLHASQQPGKYILYHKVKKKFPVDIVCKDIHYRVEKLFLACPDVKSDQYTIQVYDEDGNKISSFIIISHYENEMTVSPDGKTIYISEWKENLVKSYTIEGKLIAEYQDRNLKHPRKMTVDRKGNLFVFGSASNNIFYINPDLTYGYEMRQKSQNDQKPDSLSYDEKNNILYISSHVDKTIEVFKVAYRISIKWTSDFYVS